MMDRERLVMLGTVAGGLVLAVVLWVMLRRRQAEQRPIPAWLDYQQPPDSVAPDMLTLTAEESWAANRCRPMAASCGERSAGRRIRRTYPGSLAESDQSFIRLNFDLSGGA